jgi:hypothetical protein
LLKHALPGFNQSSIRDGFQRVLKTTSSLRFNSRECGRLRVFHKFDRSPNSLLRWEGAERAEAAGSRVSLHLPSASFSQAGFGQPNVKRYSLLTACVIFINFFLALTMSSEEISIVAAEGFTPGNNTSSHNEGTKQQAAEAADDLQLVS